METEGETTNEAADAAEPTMEALLEEQKMFRDRLASREVVWVKVVQVRDQNVLVDIGEKQEGVVPASDFDSDSIPAPGTRIPAILVSEGRHERSAQLSHKKARAQQGWQQAVKAFEEKVRVRGRVISAIKGGFLVDVGGVQAFLPSSLADLRPVRKPQALIGTGVRCVVLEVNRDKKQLVLSRKAVLEEEANKRKEKLLAKIKVGDVMIGRVSHVIPTGAFVGLGGVEGFIQTADLAWKDPEKARQGVSHGDKLRVKVMRIEAESGKIYLGAKQLMPNPSDALRRKYPVKTVLSGKVTEVTPEGVRVQVGDKVTAWCAAAELPAVGEEPEEDRSFQFQQRGRGGAKAPPRNILWPEMGAEVKGIVLGVHVPTVEVSLSIRRYEEMQDRKRVAKYLRGAPPLTLGQILTSEE